MTDRPRRLLTDWTTSAGVDGSGLLALVVGEASLPEALHLRTLGYEAFALTDAGGRETPAGVHVLDDVDPTDVPDVWSGRFGLAVLVARPDDAAVRAATRCLAPGGLLVLIGDAPAPTPTDDLGLVPVVVEVGPDPDDPAVERFRAIWAQLG